MRNKFEQYYSKRQQLNADYKEAVKVGDEEAVRLLKAEWAELHKEFEKNGGLFPYLYEKYSDMREAGNGYLDITPMMGTLKEDDVKAIVGCLKENGIEAIIVSDDGCHIGELCLRLIRNGCVLLGMVEKVKPGYGFVDEEKIPSFLFYV